MEMALTGRLRMRRQMSAAAGKMRTTSLSLFLEAYALYYIHTDLGQKEFGEANGVQNQEKHG